MEPFIVQLLNT